MAHIPEEQGLERVPTERVLAVFGKAIFRRFLHFREGIVGILCMQSYENAALNPWDDRQVVIIE